MFKSSVLFFVVILSFSLASEESAADQNVEQIQEQEILDLIESLEERVKIAEDAEKIQTEWTISNPRDRQVVRGKQYGQDLVAKAARVDHPNNLDERESNERDDDLTELRREIESLRKEGQLGAAQQGLSDSERQEQYLRSLVRLQRLYQLYDKRFGGEEDGSPERKSRHCVGELIDRRIERLQADKRRHLERSRLLADRLEQSAQRAGRGRARVIDGLRCDRREERESKSAIGRALEDAAEVVRRLAFETRAAGPRDDRSILGLAIDLVNRVTAGVTGEAEPLDGLGYEHDYARSAQGREPDQPTLSSSGFDYADYPAYDQRLDYELGRQQHYPGCDACATFDLQLGHACPVCKRSGPERRRRGAGAAARIHHLHRQTERTRRSGGVWEDTNKLYNFDDLENDKFIDLSLNCTGITDNEDCKRLQRNLVAPEGVEPVPLWYVKEQLGRGRELARDMHERALELQASRGGRPSGRSPSRLQYLGDRVPGHVVQINQESQVALLGTKLLREKLIAEYNMTSGAFKEFLEHHGFRVTGSEVCRARQESCDELAKYRSLDGSCNSERNPSWGQSYTALVRVLPPRYADGVQSMPVSVGLRALPNPRQLSSQLFSRRNAPDPRFTLALVQWGQLVAHDVARSVADQTEEGGIECCQPGGRGPLASSRQHHSCMPIRPAGSDRFYSGYNVTCLNFVRSMTVMREDCSLAPADQLNGVSSFLDLSPVYGPDKATSDSLRQMRRGEMRIEMRANRVMMPASAAASGFCDSTSTGDICYETGDPRSNQNPQLVVLQTLLVREHNRIARELAILNPHWDDETLFQEARRIVIAEYQHITYQQWLPHLLGKRYSEENKISSGTRGLTNDYDARINPGTINSFTSAAFRFLHTMIEGHINLVAENNRTSSVIRLSDYYFRPRIVESGDGFASLLRGLVRQPMQKSDLNFHEEVTEYLFRSGNQYGMDLEALDIQRGRDHGIPGYNRYREICNLGRAQDFHGLINEISLNNIEKLQRNYENVDDIDLLVGAALETRVSGSLLGPTLQCLIGEQFFRSRVGDKYFYSNANFVHSFTPEQFAEIEKASLATLICDLGEATDRIQRDPFKIASKEKPEVPCSVLPRINLELWKETLE